MLLGTKTYQGRKGGRIYDQNAIGINFQATLRKK